MLEVMSSALALEALRTEIGRVHEVFVDWFAGRCPPCDAYFGEQVLAHLAVDFVYVRPSGVVSRREALAAEWKRGYASNPGLEITIADLELRHAGADSAVVSYIEIQRGAIGVSDPDSRRLSTALFVIEEGRRVWKHVHETWAG